MFTNVIAIILIVFFAMVIAIAAWSFTRLHQLGLLAGFLRGKLLLSLLTTTLILLLMVGAVALLTGAHWATPFLTYTICVWLVYVWLYNLNSMLGTYALLKEEKAKSISHFMGRDRFFDELLEKSVEWSQTGTSPANEVGGEAHAVSDPSWAAILDDEEWFREVFPVAVRRKIRRKLTGLIVQTIILVVLLILIN